jgi:two-component system chemotaxis response regulator CheB
VSGGCVRVLSSPRDHRHRPSADVLLRSVADASGTPGCGIVLSGTMNDGAAGLAEVRRAGGLALVQDPAEALFPGMPRAAIAAADPQLVAPLAALAGRVCTWLGERGGDGGRGSGPALPRRRESPG